MKFRKKQETENKPVECHERSVYEIERDLLAARCRERQKEIDGVLAERRLAEKQEICGELGHLWSNPQYSWQNQQTRRTCYGCNLWQDGKLVVKNGIVEYKWPK